MSEYKIEIDRDTCIGDQLCCNEATNTFAMDDDNIAKVINPTGDPADTVLAAAKSCPVDCIKLTDQGGKQVWPEA
ncbi:MAG: ferredoxin [Planctomycetes bacterium]|nr:ferredoxin [Planctomycetota bacterium]